MKTYPGRGLDRRSLPTIALVLAVAAASGCVPQSHAFRARADFGSVVAAPRASDSVYLLTEEDLRGLMDTVLLSPNLVFESSRSSVGGANTIGPGGAEPPAPDLQDALGKPVDIAMSSVLMESFASKGSVLLAPAMIGMWGTSWLCVAEQEACPDQTWVERLIAGADSSDESSKSEMIDEDGNVISERGPGGDTTVPRVALAVRELGLISVEVDVVVQSSGSGVRIRPKRVAGGARSICPANVLGSLRVPAMAFSAEVVNVRDGRMLARIHEVRPFPVDLIEPVQTISLRRRSPGAVITNAARCEAIKRAYYQRVAQPLAQAVLDDLGSAVGKMVSASLGPLYP